MQTVPNLLAIAMYIFSRNKQYLIGSNKCRWQILRASAYEALHEAHFRRCTNPVLHKHFTRRKKKNTEKDKNKIVNFCEKML
jgi:hypothetical protein